jgi:predicted HicB family RNase H-like nuclease
MTPDHRKDGTFRKGNTARQNGDQPAEGHLHVRVAMESKGRWVQVSRAAGLPLSEWVIQTLDARAAAAELHDSREGQP